MFGTRAVVDVQHLAWAASDHRVARGRWPDLTTLVAADASLPRLDPWGHGYRIDATAYRLVVRSAGVDGAFDTDDDVTSDPVVAGLPAAR